MAVVKSAEKSFFIVRYTSLFYIFFLHFLHAYTPGVGGGGVLQKILTGLCGPGFHKP